MNEDQTQRLMVAAIILGGMFASEDENYSIGHLDAAVTRALTAGDRLIDRIETTARVVSSVRQG